MSEDMWQNYGQVVVSKYKRRVVLALHNRPMTPTEISEGIDVDVAHVSRALRELVKKQVVICITPDRKKGRVYSLTEKGIKIAKILEKKN